MLIAKETSLQKEPKREQHWEYFDGYCEKTFQTK